LFESIGPLDVLILSYDQYHLEFLAFQNYENAVAEAAAVGTAAILHLSYSTELELQALKHSIAALRPSLRGVSVMRVFKYGNATQPGVIRADPVIINSAEDLRRVHRSCFLGTAVVDDANRVHGCCWSVIAERSPFARELKATPLGAALQHIENDGLFRTMRRSGFLDSLSARGRAEVAARMMGQAVTQECEVCVKMMTADADCVWREIPEDSGGAASSSVEGTVLTCD
jgi:hypothetical protein